MGNNNECEIIGRGLVLLGLTENKEVLLRDVRHVPKLKRNLISLRILDDQGCTCIGEKRALKIERKGKIVLIRKMLDGLCMLRRAAQPKYVLFEGIKALCSESN